MNGFPHARMACLAVVQTFRPYLAVLWGDRRLSYHPPETLHESIIFVRMLMSMTIELFKISHYDAQYVGGEVQLIGIPFPGRVPAVR